MNGRIVLWHDRLLHDILEVRMLGKRTQEEEGYKLIDTLLESKNWTDLKKSRSIWRRDCDKRADK